MLFCLFYGKILRYKFILSMGDNLEKRNSSNETQSDSTREKLDKLKTLVKANSAYIPDKLEDPIFEKLSQVEQILAWKDTLEALIKLFDDDFEIGKNLDRIKVVLGEIKDVAVWLKDSQAGDLITSGASVLIKRADEILELTEELKRVGINSESSDSIKASIKEKLSEIINILNQAQQAIDFVKIISDGEVSLDMLYKLMRLTE